MQRQANPTHSVARLSTSSRPAAATACNSDTVWMIRLRSKRSAAGPAIGDIRNAGSDWATYTSVTRIGESVRSCTRPTNAT